MDSKDRPSEESSPRIFEEPQGQLRFELDYPERYGRALEDFIAIMKSPNGDRSIQASQYYNEIFSHDLESFAIDLSKLQDSEDCDGLFGRQLDSFIRHNPDLQEYLHQLQDSLGSTEAETKAKTEIEEVDPEYIQKLVAQQKSLIKEMAKLNAEEIETTFSKSKSAVPKSSPNPDSRKKSPDKLPSDFGIKKVSTMLTYYNFIEQNIPDSHPKLFVDTFLKKTAENSRPTSLNTPRSYVGFSFDYEGKKCAIAESFSDSSAMYLYCGAPDSDFKQMFSASKLHAKASQNVAAVSHFDPSHAEEDLSSAYQKAFLFFHTGDKQVVLYKSYGGKPEWEEAQSHIFPAWPLNLTPEDVPSQSEIDRYQAWQKSQNASRDSASNS